MLRSASKSSGRRLTPAYQRIHSEINIKTQTLPEFLRSARPFILELKDSPKTFREAEPIKPKILQKYSKDISDDPRWQNFEDFCEFLTHSRDTKVALIIHRHNISTKELKDLINSRPLSRNIIDCALSVIKKKNREITKKSEEYPRVLIGKTCFTERLFGGQSISTKVNVLKYEYILFPVIVCDAEQRETWSLMCLDNKELKLTFFNCAGLENASYLFDRTKLFITYQLNAVGKAVSDTSYRQLVYKERRSDQECSSNDSGVYMLMKCFNFAIGNFEELQPHTVEQGRSELLKILYEYGRCN